MYFFWLVDRFNTRFLRLTASTDVEAMKRLYSLLNSIFLCSSHANHKDYDSPPKDSLMTEPLLDVFIASFPFISCTYLSPTSIILIVLYFSRISFRLLIVKLNFLKA